MVISALHIPSNNCLQKINLCALQIFSHVDCQELMCLHNYRVDRFTIVFTKYVFTYYFSSSPGYYVAENIINIQNCENNEICIKSLIFSQIISLAIHWYKFVCSFWKIHVLNHLSFFLKLFKKYYTYVFVFFDNHTTDICYNGLIIITNQFHK